MKQRSTDGRYEFKVPRDPTKPETLFPALKNDLGLERVRAKRPLLVMTVSEMPVD